MVALVVIIPLHGIGVHADIGILLMDKATHIAQLAERNCLSDRPDTTVAVHLTAKIMLNFLRQMLLMHCHAL